MTTWWLCVLFLVIVYGSIKVNYDLIGLLVINSLLIIASVINDGFNKIAKILKEKDV